MSAAMLSSWEFMVHYSFFIMNGKLDMYFLFIHPKNQGLEIFVEKEKFEENIPRTNKHTLHKGKFHKLPQKL